MANRNETNKTIRIHIETHEKLRDLSYEQRIPVIELMDMAVDELVKKFNNKAD